MMTEPSGRLVSAVRRARQVALEFGPEVQQELEAHLLDLEVVLGCPLPAGMLK